MKSELKAKKNFTVLNLNSDSSRCLLLCGQNIGCHHVTPGGAHQRLPGVGRCCLTASSSVAAAPHCLGMDTLVKHTR